MDKESSVIKHLKEVMAAMKIMFAKIMKEFVISLQIGYNNENRFPLIWEIEMPVDVNLHSQIKDVDSISS